MGENISRDDVILEKLEEQSDRIKTIERTMAAIAVQNEKLASLQKQQSKLWEKYDSLVAPDGIIARINSFQAACPRIDLKAALARQWTAIGLLATIVCGTLFKALGFF